MAKQSKTELGERLKATAGDGGLTAEQIAEHLEISPAAVWAWWSGRNEPSLGSMIAYARLVRRSLQYLATGQEEIPEPGQTMADWVMAFADRVVRGEAPTAAYDQVTGAPRSLTARERRSIESRAAEMRAFIEREAGRPWTDLTEMERHALAVRLIQQADAE